MAILYWLLPIFHLPQLFLCNFRCSSLFPTTGWQTSKGKSCTGGSGAKARGNNLSLPLKGSHRFERIWSSKPWYSGECTNDKMIQNVENGCSSPLTNCKLKTHPCFITNAIYTIYASWGCHVRACQAMVEVQAKPLHHNAPTCKPGMQIQMRKPQSPKSDLWDPNSEPLQKLESSSV